MNNNTITIENTELEDKYTCNTGETKPSCRNFQKIQWLNFFVI